MPPARLTVSCSGAAAGCACCSLAEDPAAAGLPPSVTSVLVLLPLPGLEYSLRGGPCRRRVVLAGARRHCACTRAGNPASSLAIQQLDGMAWFNRRGGRNTRSGSGGRAERRQQRRLHHRSRAAGIITLTACTDAQERSAPARLLGKHSVTALLPPPGQSKSYVACNPFTRADQKQSQKTAPIDRTPPAFHLPPTPLCLRRRLHFLMRHLRVCHTLRSADPLQTFSANASANTLVAAENRRQQHVVNQPPRQAWRVHLADLAIGSAGKMTGFAIPQQGGMLMTIVISMARDE